MSESVFLTMEIKFCYFQGTTGTFFLERCYYSADTLHTAVCILLFFFFNPIKKNPKPLLNFTTVPCLVSEQTLVEGYSSFSRCQSTADNRYKSRQGRSHRHYCCCYQYPRRCAHPHCEKLTGVKDTLGRITKGRTIVRLLTIQEKMFAVKRNFMSQKTAYSNTRRTSMNRPHLVFYSINSSVVSEIMKCQGNRSTMWSV